MFYKLLLWFVIGMFVGAVLNTPTITTCQNICEEQFERYAC